MGEKMKATNESNVLRLYKPSGDFELLRLSPKSGGFVAYLPRAVVEALNLSKDDHNLIAFIDDSSSYTTLIVFKDTTLSNLLKSEILSRRQRAQKLQRELKAQLKAQQQAAETKQEVVLTDV